jgi:Ni/Co efflux regulator RcnB
MRKLITATLAFALLGGTAAVAQPYGGQRGDNRAYTQDYRGGNQFDRRDNDRFDRRGDRFDNNQTWRRGMMFRDYQRFTVNDWRRFGLHRPGRGLHWVQRGNVFLLVTQRGQVVDVIFRPGGFSRY